MRSTPQLISNKATVSSEVAFKTSQFQGYGVWSPGMRAMSSMGFRSKLAVVSSVMTLPLLVLVCWITWVEPISKNTTLLWIGLTLFLSFYLLRCFMLVVVGGLRDVSAHLKAMTDGDLTTVPEGYGHDEFTNIMRDVGVMQTSLRKIIVHIRDASQGFNEKSESIATAASNLSSRINETAKKLENSTAAMSEISTTIQQSSQQISETAEISLKNTTIAEEGSQVIGLAIEKMEHVKSSSEKINDIISTIDGIAFQTNILALNAAVEAARAGEQGRGFAVVAGEVRLLAGRSAEASKEIRNLISSTVEEVNSGAKIVKSAGSSMTEIVGSAVNMRGLLSDISTAISNNSDNLIKIGQSIKDVDQMTMENSIAIQETSSAADSMKMLAKEIVSTVATFKISSDANGMVQKKLNNEITVSPQISITDISRIKAEGFRSIICNRPDGEGPGQTKFVDIAAAAKSLGIQARHLPVQPGKVTPNDGKEFAKLMQELPKPIFAYCRTGMRCQNLWKLSH